MNPGEQIHAEFLFFEEDIPWVRCVKCKTSAKFKQTEGGFYPPLGWDSMPWNKVHYPICAVCNSELIKLWSMTVKKWVEFPLPEADA